MPQDICPLYKNVLGEAERLRRSRNIPMRYVDDMAGIPDGLYSKAAMLHRRTPRGAARPSGRVVGWQAMDEILTALAGRGYRLIVLPRTGATEETTQHPDPAQLPLPFWSTWQPIQLLLPIAVPMVTSPASRSGSAQDPAQARLPLEPEATAEQLSLSL